MDIKEVAGGLVVQAVETLPNGVLVATVPVGGARAFLDLPKVVRIDGVTYGRTGWNSDRGVAYYRTDFKLAMARTRRKMKAEAMKSLGLVKVKGALGGTYWE